MNPSKLKQAGLSEYEAKAYLALLKFGAIGGQECAKRSGVPPTRVYDALKSLVVKGLASQVQEKPLLFKAIKPEIGLKHLFRDKLQRLIDTENQLVGSLKSIKQEQVSEQKIHEKVTTVLGFNRMYNHVIELLSQTKKEFLVFSIGEDVPYELKLESKRAARRGCILKLIVTKCDSENMHILKERQKEGYQVKYYPSTGDYTFATFDKRVAFINVRNPQVKDERISSFFEVPGMANALTEHFDQIWKKAKPINSLS